MKEITFEFDGKDYEVGMEAYDHKLPIRLPDSRTIVVVNGWIETPHRVPRGFRLVELDESEVCAEAVAAAS